MLVRSRSRSPVFEDPEMMSPGHLHERGCPGAVSSEGVRSSSTCRCSSCTDRTTPGLIGRVLEENPVACLVQFDGHAPAWVERATLTMGVHLQEKPAGRIVPHDHLLAKAADLSLIHRRRRPKGGEIVFLRNDRTTSWRFLFTVEIEGVGHVLLVDPAMPPADAISPPPEATCILPLGERRIESVLVPVFPLPDGTPDPGWR